jgi:hypothetical protein
VPIFPAGSAGRTTSLGVIQAEIGPEIGGEQILLPGQFLFAAAICAAEAAQPSGSGVFVAAGVRLGFQTAGTANCFPVTIALLLEPNPPFGGIFYIDRPSTAEYATGTATQVGCFAYQ